jgi:CheY-like chemotaxis protein
MAAILWERRIVETEPSVAPVDDGLDDLALLRQELEQWEVNRQVCDTRMLLDDVRWLVEPLVEETGLRVVDSLPPVMPHVLADPTLTSQALLKVSRLVIQNSTAGGCIEVTAEATDSALEVALLGDSNLSQQGSEEWAIVELLLTRQGGRLLLEPAVGDRQRVAISLPLAGLEHVLVIDDVEAVHRLFERYLSPLNYEVSGVSDGTLALKAARNLQPDVIILDVMIPHVDGWHILRSLKEDELTAAIPVVICSVLDEPDVALGSGASAFLKKPVRREALLAVLKQVRGVQADGVERHSVAP